MRPIAALVLVVVVTCASSTASPQPIPTRTDHGHGGGPTTPGVYRIISKPSYCIADFAVTQ